MNRRRSPGSVIIAPLILFFAFIFFGPFTGTGYRQTKISYCAPLNNNAESDTHSGFGAIVDKALRYLYARQESDGGFAEPGKQSQDQLTCWAICAIASAGENPVNLKKSGNSPLDFLLRHAKDWKNFTDIERACLAVSSAGGNPRSFGGRNLVSEIKAKISNDGHIGSAINEHIWGMIALAAAGEKVPAECRAWLRSAQNSDGGFSFSQGSESDPDDTGAAIQALGASGEDASSSSIKRALEYLRFCQAPDGGFCWRSSVSNTASTSWAVQGIAAAGEDPASDAWKKGGKTPIDFLEGMQQEDGHIKYMEGNDSQPAWMTAEAIPALLKKPYPLNFKPQASNSENATTTGSTDSQNGNPKEEVNGSATNKQNEPENMESSNSSSVQERRMAMESNANEDSNSSSGMVKKEGSGLKIDLYLFSLICASYLSIVIIVYLISWLLTPGDRTL